MSEPQPEVPPEGEDVTIQAPPAEAGGGAEQQPEPEGEPELWRSPRRRSSPSR